MKYLPSILAFTVTSLGFGVFVAHAQNYVPLAPLPGTAIDLGSTTTNLSAYLSGMLKLLIAVGGALSILMAIIAGTKYVAAGISPDAKSSAKSDLANAFIGLALVLSSYLILNSINPKLVQFNLMLPTVTAPKGVSPVAGLEVGGVAAPVFCASVTPFSLVLDTPEARNMEAGQTVIFTSSDPVIQANLTKLKAEVIKLQDALYYKVNPPALATVNSAYRPIEYQKHLYQLYTAWKVQGLETNTDSTCSSIKAVIGAEYRRHGLKSLVANPDGNAPHTKGAGVDLTITGFPLQNINAFMASNNINLSWQNITGDENHFNLR